MNDCNSQSDVVVIYFISFNKVNLGQDMIPFKVCSCGLKHLHRGHIKGGLHGLVFQTDNAASACCPNVWQESLKSL